MKSKMVALKGPLAAILLSLLMVLTISCSSDDGSPSTPAEPIAVSGYVSKAAVSGSTVNLWSFSNTGEMNQLVAGPFTTDATGAWSGEVPGGSSGNLLVVANGGSYIDESTGGTVTVGSNLYGILRLQGSNSGNATPMTHAMVLNAQARIAAGDAVSTAVNGAVADITAAFGYDLTSTAPVLSTVAARADGDLYTVFLAGISTLLDGNPALSPAFDLADTWDLVMGVATDLSDGVLDGIDIFDDAVMVDPGGPTPAQAIPFPPLDMDDISELIDAANAWAAANAPGSTLSNIDFGTFGEIDDDIEPGDVTVTGSLTVTGGDAAQYGNPFTPATVLLAESGGSVGGFVFNQTETKVLTITVNPLDLVPAIVNAQNMQNFWNATLMIPGLTITETGSGWTLDFSSVTLTKLYGATSIVLDGTLTVTNGN